MHDLGNVEAWRGEKRIRGGGYWGVASEEVRDLAAWHDFAEALGFRIPTTQQNWILIFDVTFLFE